MDVQERYFQWPIGPWAKGERLKAMGMLFRQELVHGLDGAAMALLTRGLGMEPGRVKEWVEEARGSLMDAEIHAYMPGYVILCLFGGTNADLLQYCGLWTESFLANSMMNDFVILMLRQIFLCDIVQQ